MPHRLLYCCVLVVRVWLLLRTGCFMCGMCRVLHAWDVSDWTGVPGIPVCRAWGRLIECRRGTWMVVP